MFQFILFSNLEAWDSWAWSFINTNFCCYWFCAGADCKVSNTRMFQGQSFEGGTFESQLVRWSVKIVRELPSFSSFKRRGGQLLPQSGSLSQRITHSCQWYLLSYVHDVYGLLQRPHWTFMRRKKRRELRGKMPKFKQNAPNLCFVLPRSLGLYYQ